MGRRGPLPQTRTAKILSGNFRRDRNTTPGITPAKAGARAPRPPKDLTQEEREIWSYYAAKLAQLGLLDALSLHPFHMLVSELALHQKISKALETEGMIYTTARGIPRIHPLVSAEKKVWSNCLQLMRDFGLTPASRQRLRLEPVPPPPTSKLAKYLHAERKKEERFFGPDAS